MTALTQYARLETVGLWRAAPGPAVARGRRVVRLGDAGPDRRRRRAPRPLVAARGPPAQPRRAARALRARRRRRARRWRSRTTCSSPPSSGSSDTVARARRGRRAGSAGRSWPGSRPFGLAGGVLWLPGRGARRQALEVVPVAKRSEIGATHARLPAAGPRRRLPRPARRRLARGAAAAGARGAGAGAGRRAARRAARRRWRCPAASWCCPRRWSRRRSEPAAVADAILAARAAQPDPLAARARPAGPDRDAAAARDRRAAGRGGRGPRGRPRRGAARVPTRRPRCGRRGRPRASTARRAPAAPHRRRVGEPPGDLPDLTPSG